LQIQDFKKRNKVLSSLPVAAAENVGEFVTGYSYVHVDDGHRSELFWLVGTTCWSSEAAQFTPKTFGAGRGPTIRILDQKFKVANYHGLQRAEPFPR